MVRLKSVKYKSDDGWCFVKFVERVRFRTTNIDYRPEVLMELISSYKLILRRVHCRANAFLGNPTLVETALSFTAEFLGSQTLVGCLKVYCWAFSFFLFYPTTALSALGEASQQMYTRGSVIGAATIIDPEISPTPPLIFYRGQKVDFWPYRSPTLEFELLWFGNRARYLHHFKTWGVSMIRHCPHQVWCRSVHAF